MIWVDLDVDGKALKTELGTGFNRNLIGVPCTKLDCC